MLIGSGAALVIAYVVRFLTIGMGGVESGLARVSPRIDDAARGLGARGPEILRRLHWPLARGATAAAAPRSRTALRLSAKRCMPLSSAQLWTF